MQQLKAVSFQNSHDSYVQSLLWSDIPNLKRTKFPQRMKKMSLFSSVIPKFKRTMFLPRNSHCCHQSFQNSWESNPFQEKKAVIAVISHSKLKRNQFLPPKTQKISDCYHWSFQDFREPKSWQDSKISVIVIIIHFNI